MRKILTVLSILSASFTYGQNSYHDSLNEFRNDYVSHHEVVKGEGRKSLDFFPISESAKILARFEHTKETKWITMETSSGRKKTFLVYGYAYFNWRGTDCRLTIYQSQSLMNSDEYKDYLFLPFTDLTNGESTYEIGRYIDLKLGDVNNGQVLLDFNKAYNPYCAYVSDKYNCPVPPKENALSVKLEAGEKKFHRES